MKQDEMDSACSKDWTEVHKNFYLENLKKKMITSNPNVEWNINIILLPPLTVGPR
jgi:hypothetical protein